MTAATKQATVTVYQRKVALRAITPMIRRRLCVTSDTTIAQLHDVVQIAMGWEDLQLHQFRIHGKTYGCTGSRRRPSIESRHRALRPPGGSRGAARPARGWRR